MLKNELLEYMECSVPHKCATKDSKCAHCVINYSFIVHNPVMLQCEHQICQECEKKTKERNIKCKICALNGVDSLIRSSGLRVNLTEKTINSHLGEFYEILKNKFTDGHKLFKDSKTELELSVQAKKQKVKNEIDLKIETIRNELERIRAQLYADVDKYSEIALQ